MQLKILTFNIHKGVSFASSKLILEKVLHLLQKVDADIIFLQEVQGEHAKRQSKFANWPGMTQTEFLATDTWPYFYYGKNHSHVHGHHGNAILSKYPLKNFSNIDISASTFSSRGLLYAQAIVDMDKPPIHLICTHLGLLKKERQKQFTLINDFIRNNLDADAPLILAGDFNDWRSQSLKLLNKELGLNEVFNILHGSFASSFPAKMPLLKVDRIYYRNLTPKECSTIKAKSISDHLPLSAVFTLNED